MEILRTCLKQPDRAHVGKMSYSQQEYPEAPQSLRRYNQPQGAEEQRYEISATGS